MKCIYHECPNAGRTRGQCRNHLRVLVVCETSGVLSGAFRAKGHEAYSCDILPCDRDEDAEWHYETDYRVVLESAPKWDIIVGHPPCTALCVSGNRWYAGTAERQNAVNFVAEMMGAFTRFSRVGWAIENPVGVLSTELGKPNQYIQPFDYGHPESKKTGLWLHGLAELQPTDPVDRPPCGYWDNQTPSGQNKLPPSADRWKIRSKTYKGIATAMANQWGHSCRTAQIDP